MGITREGRHKRRHTGGKRADYRKKRKFELGRPPSNTKLGEKNVHRVRCMGGNLKWRAMSLETGNFSWGSEVQARKTRIIDVVYNSTNNELVRTKTLVKGCIVAIDATPFRQWYLKHYKVDLAVKGKATIVDDAKSEQAQKKYKTRQRTRTLDPSLQHQMASGRLLACISSRPGQSGRADGYVLEGKEYDFYKRKLETKKSKK